MFETQTDINVSIYIGGKTLRDNEKSLLQIYDYLRRIGGLFDAEVELESHVYKETSHYDTATQPTYVGELWMSSDGEWPVPIDEKALVVRKIAELIKLRASLTSDISGLWESLAEKDLDAMNNILTQLKRTNQGDSPISMSLDELSIAERDWAERVSDYQEGKE